MELNKNLHISIPNALLAAAEKEAAEQHVSMDELMHEAVKRYLDDREWRGIRIR